ncbi:hypothetical protein OIV57_23025 [Burkholderia pseudomallei]|uniref:hypothetical protein n=2 Tax=Burkholderia TaxID=32008 RepID=UPI0021F791FC|nr:hypothetical protein [Burkholderia pseudomallei]MCV9915009.1 hypothetical protein [Burkholderia pseudomallei]MCW0071047.1 hypothetical protein [Burkholderia pseudomallei]
MNAPFTTREVNARDEAMRDERASADRHQDSPALQRIYDALDAAPSAIVDRPVALDRELTAATFGLRRNRENRIYADVPLTALVGLFHRTWAPDATTWRSLLDGLHGRGWGSDTLAYFESEIGDAHFPAPAAAYPLILRAYGGAVVCVNGMHRLVAGVCWLAAQQGVEARLRKVELQIYDVKRAAVTVMVDALGRGETVHAAINTDCETVLIRARSAGADRYWHVDGDQIEPIPAPGGRHDAWRRWLGQRARAEAGLTWQTVPPTVIAALADDGWLRAQRIAPRYVDSPR